MAEGAAIAWIGRRLGILENEALCDQKTKERLEEMGFVARSGGISDRSNPSGCELRIGVPQDTFILLLLNLNRNTSPRFQARGTRDARKAWSQHLVAPIYVPLFNNTIRKELLP